MRRHSPVRGSLLNLSAGLSAFAALCMTSGVAYSAESLLPIVYNETIRGGVVVDGVGMTSTTTVEAKGNLTVQLPLGATVERAWLVSGVSEGYLVGRPILTPIAATPRQVVFGTGANAATFQLEGKPTYTYVDDASPIPRNAAYGSWVNEVTTQVRGLVGATAPATAVSITVAERGDGTEAYTPSIYGHSLAVVYRLASAPSRNVVVGAGLFGGPSECTTSVKQSITMKSPVTKKCVGAAFPISVTVIDNRENCDNGKCEFSANGMSLSTAVAGGEENVDKAAVAASSPANDLGLMSTGSFGASGPLAVPLGLSKTFKDAVVMTDVIVGALPIGPRTDDELYDLAPTMAEGDTTVALQYASNICDALPMIAFQANADCGPPCTTDAQCGAGFICHNAAVPNACIAKVANGGAIPAGGALGGTCSAEKGTRACVSGVCETSDNKCGLNLGSTCTATAQCRTGECGTVSKKCEVGPATDAGVSDSGVVDSGPVPTDAGRPVVDAGRDAASSVPPADESDAGASLPGSLDGPGSLEGGGCVTSSAGGSASSVPVLLVAALALATARRRRSQSSSI